jgi:hypothetical protein
MPEGDPATRGPLLPGLLIIVFAVAALLIAISMSGVAQVTLLILLGVGVLASAVVAGIRISTTRR